MCLAPAATYFSRILKTFSLKGRALHDEAKKGLWPECSLEFFKIALPHLLPYLDFSATLHLMSFQNMLFYVFG